MKNRKNLIFYVSTIGLFSTIIYITLYFGKNNLEQKQSIYLPDNQVSAWINFIESLLLDMTSPVAMLLLQVVIILLAVRTFGWICQKIGQPSVIGEIIAGVVLGPSLLGTYFPEISLALFPPSSLGSISLLSQIGLVLFMFIVGMELDLKVLKTRANNAVVISHASIIFPFALGIVLAYFLYDHFSHKEVQFTSFALFIGIAMSITAFPVLARIVHEKGINKTPLGAIVITCAAIDDITAWCLLAAVIAIVKAGSFASSIYVILLAILYVVAMLVVVRPFLKRIADLQTTKNMISKSIVGIFFLVLFLSAYATEVIGIHALFGAFLTGVIMPQNINFRNLFVEKIEDVALVLLLPLFFVYTGLRTQIGLLNDSYLWMVCGAIILVAVTGKFVGSALAARFVGQNWRDSLTIGALMNTRGLMELVVLNIGYDLGVLTDEMFAMMVVMALFTTFMTSPALGIINRIFKKTSEIEAEHSRKFKMLISFENPKMGKKLLSIANSFVKKDQSHSELTMLHLSLGNNLYQYSSELEEHEVFAPIIEEAKALKQPIIPVFEIANEISNKVAKIANEGEFDFLLVGLNSSIYEGNFLGRVLGFSQRLLNIPNQLYALIEKNKKVTTTINTPLDDSSRAIIAKSDVPVGVFIDRGLGEIKHIFVPILDEDDIFIGEFMERITSNSYVRITLWDAIGLSNKSIEFVKSVRAIKAVNPYLFLLWNNNIELGADILKKQDLMMVSLESWKKIQDSGLNWIDSVPSTLVINK